MTAVYLRLCRRNQLIDQIVGFYAKAPAPGNFDINPTTIVSSNLISKLLSATWRQRNHLIGEVRVVRCLICIAQAAKRLDYIRLRIGLARINHVIDSLCTAKMGMFRLALFRRNPAEMIRICKERVVSKIASQQPKLP